MVDFGDRMVGYADENGGSAGGAQEQKYLEKVRSSRGYHPDYDAAERYSSLSIQERNETLAAIRDNRVFGDGNLRF